MKSAGRYAGEQSGDAMKGCAIALLVWVLLPAAARAALLHVPADYATIQAAVDAAQPDDVVMIAPGVYEEQVVVTVDLVLQGSGTQATVIQAPTELPYTVGAAGTRPIVVAHPPATRVTITGLAVDGLGRGPEDSRFVGIMYYYVGGRILDVEVHSIHHTPVADHVAAIGVLASAYDGVGDIPLEIADLTVTRFQRSGLVVNGWAYEADIRDVHVDPQDIAAPRGQNGIELNQLHHASLTRAHVQGVYFHEPDYPEYTSCGVLAYHSLSLDFSEVTLEENQAGVYLVRTSLVAEELTIAARTSDVPHTHGVIVVGQVPPTKTHGGMRLPEPLPDLDGMEGGAFRPLAPWDVHLRDCIFDGQAALNSVGILTLEITAQKLNILVERSQISRWAMGVQNLELGIGIVAARFSGVLFAGNNEIGILSLAVTALDARGCHWNHSTGPHHDEHNPGGQGDIISDNVLFEPWLSGNVAPLPLPQYISLADHDGAAHSDTVSVEYVGGADDLLYGFSATLAWDPEIVTAVSVARPARGAFSDALVFLVLPTSGGLTVDAAVGGSHPGIASGPLLTIRYAAVGMPDWTECPLELTVHHARSRSNHELDGISTDDGLVVVDLQAPVIHSFRVENLSLPHTDDFAKHGDMLTVIAEVSEEDPGFGVGHVRGALPAIYGVEVFLSPPDSYAAGEIAWHPRPANLQPADGEAYIGLFVRDPAGNAVDDVSTFIIADNTPPAVITGLQATPGHNLIDLAWDDPAGGDLHHRRTIVRATRWYDYPLYATPEPDYPQDVAGGDSVLVAGATATQLAFAADGSERDIYYFSAFAEDMAGNVSPPAATSQARTTSYRLGDVCARLVAEPGDGIVDIFDISRLGDSYTLRADEPGFDPECDVGPTDGGASGIPLPDGEVGFEDLMVFADQFELDASPREPTPSATVAAHNEPSLSWQRVDPRTWALVLTAPYPQLKGLHLLGESSGASLRVEAGSLLHAQPASWFLHHGRGACEVHLAMLGAGVGVSGQGEILRLVADRPVDLPLPRLTLRDLWGKPLGDETVVAPLDSPERPVAFKALLPYPNPFNPASTIAFELPTPQPVSLVIFSLDGRRTRTLLHDDLPAGRHRARWDGRDHAGRPVAAGMYLYRLRAGPWAATGKLELVK